MTTWRYFKLDDIVENEKVWGQKLFVIHGFGGNDYLPLLYVHPLNQKCTTENSCNWNAKNTKLVSFSKRPLRNISLTKLKNLLRRGNKEAKREFIVRNNETKRRNGKSEIY